MQKPTDEGVDAGKNVMHTGRRDALDKFIEVLDDATDEKKKKVFLGVLGASGTGKSTMLNALARLLDDFTDPEHFLENPETRAEVAKMLAAAFCPNDDQVHQPLDIKAFNELAFVLPQGNFSLDHFRIYICAHNDMI